VARIEKVEACIARVPLDTPIAFATRTVAVREYLLVRVHAAGGVTGIGYSYAGNNACTPLLAAVTDLLAPRLIGDDSLRIEGLWRDLYQESLLQGRVGAVMRALSALDIAQWDLNARAVGLPLYQYLGACVLDRVPAYASGGYYLQGKSTERLSDEFGGYVRDGYTAVKMKVGRLPPRDEQRRVQAVRAAIGPDVLLMLDANNAWRDLPTALRYMRLLEDFDPYWIEEPFSPDDIDNHARLARCTPVMVATGEIEAGRWRFKEILDNEAAAILQTDAIVCGGITEWRRIAAAAASYGITVSPHAWHDVHVHLVAATPNATFVEFMPDDHIVNFRRLIDTQLVVEAGHVLLPRTPGLGFAFDDAAIARYGVPRAPGETPWHAVS
jgi:L-alanine-DL-glutamate epimerase-like enolase superfamily enzyme